MTRDRVEGDNSCPVSRLVRSEARFVTIPSGNKLLSSDSHDFFAIWDSSDSWCGEGMQSSDCVWFNNMMVMFINSTNLDCVDRYGEKGCSK